MVENPEFSASRARLLTDAEQAGLPASRLMFDWQDYALLRIVRDVLGRPEYPEMRRLLVPHQHPHGIKEMAAGRGLRIAYAVIHLLGSLEDGRSEDRINALRTLREEALAAPESDLARNTARVLIQLMKELVRSAGDPVRQLELAHDFRMAIAGRPRFTRRELRRMHLIELPEAWDHLAFDDHVHDANTRGRKSPTHLVLDAWVKGIRLLTVIHDNFIRPDVAAELLQSAEIMGLSVRIGIDLRARYGEGYARLIWIPKGFTDAREFLSFLTSPDVVAFMSEEQEVSQYHQRYVMAVLEKFNNVYRPELSRRYEIDVEPVDPLEFLRFVGVGQASLLHLARYLQNALLPLLIRKAEAIHSNDPNDPRLRELADQMNALDTENLVETYLAPARNPELRDPDAVTDETDLPPILRLSPWDLVKKIRDLHTKNRIVLTVQDLRIEDVLIILADCMGAITHLEIFNLKHSPEPNTPDLAEVIELQNLLNAGNVMRLKKFVKRLITRLEDENGDEAARKLDRLKEILDDIAILQALYKGSKLKASAGTDSTGRSSRHHGMGLVVEDTLPWRARRQLLNSRHSQRCALPVGVAVAPRDLRLPPEDPVTQGARRPGLLRLLSWLPRKGLRRTRDWIRLRYYVAPREGPANIYTLGGIDQPCGDRYLASRAAHEAGRTQTIRFSWRYLNSRVKNTLKILAGFIPASVSFALTNDWWVLAWFGPAIWFAITGLRVIAQSVLGSGGLRRTPLLKWNDYVSWSRFSDTLLYTGLSIPLLDWLVKTVFLKDWLGITALSASGLFYAVLALVNGVYLTTHNILRGLPREAAIGNFFRSVLSIPLALFINAGIVLLLGLLGVPDVEGMLQLWGATISKFASECVAAVIEGVADRSKYIALRVRDFKGKFKQIYDTYGLLEMLYPQQDLATLLESPKELIATLSSERKDLEKIVIVNALDCLYFWMYQPRARTVLARSLGAMSQDERKAFLLSQYVLQREREITQLFLDGLVGKKFAKALTFYLSNVNDYLDEIQHLAIRHAPEEPEKRPLDTASPCAPPAPLKAPG